jgi:hypothetical protein
MPNPSQHKEAVRKPSVTESVQSLIDRKRQEKESKVSADVSRKMAGTQEGVADVLAGMEKPSETISERQGEGAGQGDLKAGKRGGSNGQAAQQIRSGLKDYVFPSEEVMVKQIRSAVEDQIRLEWRRARGLEGKIDQGGAQAYNSSIARIRKLGDLLESLLASTVDFLKNLYVKYFTPDGKRRNPEEV